MHSMHDVALVFGRRAAALTLSAMLLFVSTLAPSAALAQSAPAVTRPIVNVLCQFGDEPDRQGATPAGVQSLYDGSSGLTSYLREQSNGSLSVVASTLAWFVLPSSRATYMPHNSVPVDQVSLAAGCTAAAGPSLSMTPDTILVLWFNDDSIGSYTNAALSQTIDGVRGAWPTVFIGASASTSPSLVAHELGHAFHMGHSDVSGWDPMGGAAMFGPLGPGYTAFHRDVAGWIPANRKTILLRQVRLTQLTQPDASDPMVAYVPLPNGESYSIEYRRQVGFDASISAEGVFIYLVKKDGLNGTDVDAQMQAAGSGPAFEADIWRPNEIFVDAVNQVKIQVKDVSNGTATVALERYDAMPLPPTNLAVTASSATSLSLSWSEPTPHIDAFLLQYRPSASTGAWQYVKLPDPTRAYTLTGLAGSTAYDVTLQSCQGGIDDCTAMTRIATSTTGAPPTSPTVTLGQVSASTAQLNWTDADPTIGQYTVTLGQPAASACSVMQTVTVPSTTLAYTLTGLQPDTAYCGWVSAVNGVGTTPSWPWFGFTTPSK